LSRFVAILTSSSSCINIRQAIVSASQYHLDYMSISRSTIGVVFLGTPHRGCRAAKWATLIASLAPPLFVTEDRILRELEEQSGTLTDRLRDFSSWLIFESVRVVCCYEARVTDYSSRVGVLGKVLRSEHVRILYWPPFPTPPDISSRLCLRIPPVSMAITKYVWIQIISRSTNSMARKIPLS
jgi:hypothetical protein